MSLAVDAVPVADLDLESTPPCGLLHPDGNGGHYECTEPAVARLMISCSVCGYRVTVFACAAGELDILTGYTVCSACTVTVDYLGEC